MIVALSPLSGLLAYMSGLKIPKVSVILLSLIVILVLTLCTVHCTIYLGNTVPASSILSHGFLLELCTCYPML